MIARTVRRERGWEELLPGLFRFRDTCNVYVLMWDGEGVAVDFGSGAWLDALPEIGVRSIRHVLLTHVHRDQCAGLAKQGTWPFEVHAPAQDLRFCQPEGLAEFWRTYQAGGCPASYAAPRAPLPCVRGDVGEAQDVLWGEARFCAIPTPGHTRGALTYVTVWGGKSVAFCGDAVHEGGTLHQPYHLEWDHWTAQGALVAWYGLERLGVCRIDLLCPSHGAPVKDRPGECVRRTQRRVMALVRAKGSVCAGAPDRWFATESMACGVRRVLPDLYPFGGNSYLLVGDRGEGFVVDPTLPGVEGVADLMDRVGMRRIAAATASHYHRDHSDGLNWLRDRYDAEVWLHPWVAGPLQDRNRDDLPWLPADSVTPDRLLPEAGTFRWNRYRFQIWPFPGQTWWHCAFQTEVAGQRVLFSGDNFQPPSRWNGTGGFCSFNGSRFSEGFSRSAATVLELSPDLICNGHGCVYRYSAGHYRRILRWSERAERAVRDLCPSEAWLADYDCRGMAWVPFRSETRPGETVALQFQVRNHGKKPTSVSVAAVLPEGWTAVPGRRRGIVPGGKTRRFGFEVRVPKGVKAGRCVIAADVEADGVPLGEAAVALVDVEG